MKHIGVASQNVLKYWKDLQGTKMFLKNILTMVFLLHGFRYATPFLLEAPGLDVVSSLFELILFLKRESLLEIIYEFALHFQAYPCLILC